MAQIPSTRLRPDTPGVSPGQKGEGGAPRSPGRGEVGQASAFADRSRLRPTKVGRFRPSPVGEAPAGATGMSPWGSTPNPGKVLVREVRGARFARYPLKTHVITDADTVERVVQQYAVPHIQPGDLLAISERIVAITQGRAYPIRELSPRWLARVLARWVFKPSWGIGIGSPWTMELALREAGVLRVLLGGAASAITKPFGIRGVFYHVVGKNIAAIDGPTPYTLPPYNEYAKLPPKDPEAVASALATQVRVPVALIDANDIGVQVLGASADVDRALVRELFQDNPLGQTNEQTPLCIVRPVS